MHANKRPLRQVANITNIISKQGNNKNDAKYLNKRGLDSPFVNVQSKKKNVLKVTNDENSCVEPSTNVIESKLKNIKISQKKTTKNDGGLVKAVKNRASKQNFNDWKQYYKAPQGLPENVADYDKTQISNIDAEPYYAYDIFQYLKQKEISTKCQKYMHKQDGITEKMRAVLVDWLVEVQQTFELNHETLYHAVKLMDHYLMHSNITRLRYQLLGITSLFISAKLDERIYPILEDFIYISDDAYTNEDMIRMETEILQVLKFDINYPLSYSFLRRFSQCSSQSIETLTLSRYILETSLMDYSLIDELDSKMAAAALLLALKMKNLTWNETLEFYSGYKEDDLKELIVRLNTLIKTKTKNETIRTKYSHSVFFEVSKIKPLDDI